MGWLLSFTTSFVVYYVLCLVWPTKNQRLVREMGLKWEEMGDREIVAADGTVIPAENEGYPDLGISPVDEKGVASYVHESDDATRKIQ